MWVVYPQALAFNGMLPNGMQVLCQRSTHVCHIFITNIRCMKALIIDVCCLKKVCEEIQISLNRSINFKHNRICNFHILVQTEPGTHTNQLEIIVSRFNLKPTLNHPTLTLVQEILNYTDSNSYVKPVWKKKTQQIEHKILGYVRFFL